MTFQTNSSVRPVSTDGGKFGSAVNPLSPDFLSYDTPDTLSFAGDFTIEFWYKSIDRSTARTILEIANLTGVRKMKIRYKDNKIEVDGYTDDLLSLTLPVDELWHHVAWVRNSGINYLWVDETRSTTVTESSPVTYAAGTTTKVSLEHGLLDEVRITNGTARYLDTYSSSTRTPERPFGENDGSSCP
jgi:hypothetical protein